MKESIDKREKTQKHSPNSKLALAVWALALALSTWCEQHFPNDKFLMNVSDSSGTINYQYEHSLWSAWSETMNIDVKVKERSEGGYVAYIAKGKAKPYQIVTESIDELKSKLEYEIVILHSEYIKEQTQQNANNKTISFADAYDSFLKESKGIKQEMQEKEARLQQINSQIQELKKDKTEHNKQMIKGLQQEKKNIEKRLKEIKKPIEVPYNK